jgi:hypothetical protein
MKILLNKIKNNKIFCIICLISVLILIWSLSRNNFIENFDINPKYFKELKGNNHLDKKYGEKNITLDEIHNTLIETLQFFVNYSKKNNIKPIIMHGTLIGYYFNKKLLPWDDDIDIILVEESITNLKNYEDDNYIIKVNPYSKDRSIKDVNNKIDARVISKKNGVFIDITFFVFENEFCAKDKHCYKKNDILPLKKSKFENIDIYIPNNVKNCLIQEYGEKVLKPFYKEWIFDKKTQKWTK